MIGLQSLSGNRQVSIAMVTGEDSPDPRIDPYTLDLDETLKARFDEYGIVASPVPWWDDKADWKQYDCAILHSCDCQEKPVEFRNWLEKREKEKMALFNPYPVVRWNMDKIYLKELNAQGFMTIPTAWCGKGDSLGKIMEENHWRMAVYKPRISCGGMNTFRVLSSASADHKESVSKQEPEFQRLSQDRDMMVQEYVEAIETNGEVSLIFFDNEYSHSVLRTPKSGGFLSQPVPHGGTKTLHTPSDKIVGEAQRVMNFLRERFGKPCLYGRVDGIVDGSVANRMRLTLMEVELIAPSLGLSLTNGVASAKLAEAIKSSVSSLKAS